MKKESNKGIYIFWGVVVLIIIAVLLFVFIPRNQPYLAYNSLNEVIVNTNEGNSQTKSIENYRTNLDNLGAGLVSHNNLNDLTNYSQILSAINRSNDFNLQALLFINANLVNKSLSSNVSLSYSDLTYKIDDLQNFCKEKVVPFMQITNKNTNQCNEIVANFLTKYKPLILAYSTYYSNLAKVIESCSIQGIIVNELTITKNTEFFEEVSTALSQTLTYSSVLNCTTKAEEIYDVNYYQNYFE